MDNNFSEILLSFFKIRRIEIFVIFFCQPIVNKKQPEIYRQKIFFYYNKKGMR